MHLDTPSVLSAMLAEGTNTGHQQYCFRQEATYRGTVTPEGVPRAQALRDISSLNFVSGDSIEFALDSIILGIEPKLHALVWWRWRESNPRPRTLTVLIYVCVQPFYPERHGWQRFQDPTALPVWGTPGRVLSAITRY